MAETPDQKRRGENLNRLTEQFAAKNNEAMMNLVKRVEEQTKKADDANRKRISDGELTAKELKDLKKVVETGRINGQFASKQAKEDAARQVAIAERGSSGVINRLKEQGDTFKENAESNEKSRLAAAKYTQNEVLELKEIAKGNSQFTDAEKASAQLELKKYEEEQKKISIFEKIAARTVEGLDNLAAPEGETAEEKEKRVADQKVFGKIKDGITATGKAFGEFAGKYGKAAKEGGLKLLKGFAIGLIIVSLLKFIRSPAFDDLLDALQGFFGFVDTLVDQFGIATTATLALVALFKPSLFMLPLKLAIGLLKGGYKFLTDATVRQAADVKMTKAFTKLGNGVKFLGDGIKSAGSGLMNAGAKSLEFAKSLGTSALSLGGKTLTALRTAGLVMKTSMIALGQGLLTFATTTLMPMLIPLAPFIAIGAAIAAVLYSLYEGFQSFRDSLASGDSLVDAIINGVSTALATLVSLPAVMFQKLLSFVTGILGFDDLSERIGNVDIVGTVTDSIKNILMSAKDFLVDLFTFDTANFPSFGDFGGYAKRALATLARNVLPEPGGFLAKFIPDSIYEFAGINPETGEFLTQQNTQDMDGGIEGAIIKKKKETEDRIAEINKDQAVVDAVQRTYSERADRHAGIVYNKKGKMIRGRFVSEKTKQRADQKASLEMQDLMKYNVNKLETKESELAAQGGQLSEDESRKLRVYKQIIEKRGDREFNADKGGFQTFGMDLYDVDRDLGGIHSEQYKLQTELMNIKNMSPDAVRDQDLVTNQFRGMDGIDVSKQKNITKDIVETFKRQGTGMDSTAGVVKTQLNAISKLIDPDQINEMRDKVARINQILKDGVTDEERTELSTMGIDTSRNFVQRTFNMDAGVTEESRAEAVRLRDAILKNTADQQAIQKNAGNVSSVVAPQYYTTSNKQDIIQPIIHENKEPPAGSQLPMAFR